MAKSTEHDELSEKLTTLNAELTRVKSLLERERISRVATNMIETITSPAFVEKMLAAGQKTDAGAGLESMKDLLAIDELRKAGAEIPDDFRIASRVFEDKSQGLRIEVTPQRDSTSRPAAGGVCGGFGRGAICACGGIEF